MERGSALCTRRQTEEAILRTVLYSDIFDYPLTPAEIAHYLIGAPAKFKEITASLSCPQWLNGQITQVNGYVTVRGREFLINRRIEKSRLSSILWRRARLFAKLLACLPYVRMVAITGALAVDNSSTGEDVDVLIVTVPGRVWLTRALSILIVRAGRLFGETLCPNYLISERVLSLPQQTLYDAHELVQMVPIFGCSVHQAMCDANQWVHTLLPNARQPLHFESEYRPGWILRKAKGIGEHLLGGRLGDLLEKWEMKRKLRKFQMQIGYSKGGVIFDRDQVKGHFMDHGAAVAAAYDQRLREFELL